MHPAFENEPLIRSVKPSIGLNTWIHYHVLHLYNDHAPNYSTEQLHAISLMNQLQKEGYRFQIKFMNAVHTCHVYANDSLLVKVEADSFELVICRAALLVRRTECLAKEGYFVNGI